MTSASDPALATYFAADPSVERLVQALALAQGFQLHIVLCNSQYVARALIEDIKHRTAAMREENVESRYIDIFDGLPDAAIRDAEHVDRLMSELTKSCDVLPENLLLFVDCTAERRIDEASWLRLFERLNQRRDVIARCVNAPFSIVIPLGIERLLATSAPDFWSFRAAQVVIEPPASDLPEPADSIGATDSETDRQTDVPKIIPVDCHAIEIARADAAAAPDDAQALKRLIIVFGRAVEQATNAQDLELAWSLTQDRVDAARRRLKVDPASSADLALVLIEASQLAGESGRLEQSLELASESVILWRHLAELQPESHLANLAGSLNKLGASLRSLGRREEVLELTSEAVEILRKLAQARPEMFQSDLARSLYKLGLVLGQLGRQEAALEAMTEAMEILRKLAHARPDAFQPDLASSLNILGFVLGQLGRQEAAVEARSEAVEILRKLAHARPDAFQADLARSLSSLGIGLSKLGRREEALEATTEAVDTFRRLARARPEALLPSLAKSLSNLGNRLSALGRREEALEATAEADEIRRKMAIPTESS